MHSSFPAMQFVWFFSDAFGVTEFNDNMWKAWAYFQTPPTSIPSQMAVSQWEITFQICSDALLFVSLALNVLHFMVDTASGMIPLLSEDSPKHGLNPLRLSVHVLLFFLDTLSQWPFWDSFSSQWDGSLSGKLSSMHSRVKHSTQGACECFSHPYNQRFSHCWHVSCDWGQETFRVIWRLHLCTLLFGWSNDMSFCQRCSGDQWYCLRWVSFIHEIWYLQLFPSARPLIVTLK